VAPNFLPHLLGVAALIQGGGGTGRYLAAARRTGSLGYTVSELRAQPEWVRALTDATLVPALRLRLTPAPGHQTRCLHLTAPGVVSIRPPGVIVRSAIGGKVTLGRFATSPTVSLGPLVPNRFSTLAIPPDQAPEPWHVALPSGPVDLCPLAGSPT
jgi:hypothetical protein